MGWVEEIKPRTLESILDLDIAFNWLQDDVSDDFYPDSFLYSDLISSKETYLEARKYRLWQLDTLQHLCEYVPKKSGLLRTAHWIHPTHRILFLAILHHFLFKIDKKLSRSLYSYRASNSENPEEYPFKDRVGNWMVFINNFRGAALTKNSKAVLITDLASFFDHISCEKIIQRIENLLGAGITDNDREVLILLQRLLSLWSNDGFAIPQNLDTSSFLGNLYLHNVDEEISRKYKYFRYVDDIRIVAESEEETINALHDLQRALARDKMFLASDKTRIVMVGSDEFNELMDVKDDVHLSEVEEIIKGGNYARIQESIDLLFSRLEFHSTKGGDERKFRAYLNKILEIGDYEEFHETIHGRLKPLITPRLRTFPERSDYWFRALSIDPDDSVEKLLANMLIERPSVYDWQKFYLWRLALYINDPPKELIDKAIEVADNHESENVSAQAIIFLGKHGDHTIRENLFKFYTNRRAYVVQRAVLIALQELPNKSTFYKRAIQMITDHKELVDYLLNLKSPKYGEKFRTTRKCKDEPLNPEAYIKQGIGLKDGEIVEYRLLNNDLEYS